MSDRITIEFDSAPVQAALNRLLDALGPAGMAPAMKEVGEVLMESTKQRFATSTAPDGTRWAPNAQATFESYLNRDGKNFRQDGRLGAKGAARAMNKKPLVDTGILADTIAWQLVDGGAGVEVGTNRFAGEWDGGAAVHQFGNRKGTIPARPFLGLSEADEVEVLEIIERHLLGALGG
ncbi:MAG: phage virion morphogenesis protein [Aromatoleum sp.]|uniref:phage virion morphogenesis protein n=1 Tax=Aromatoleum sp. TaxID=2307007 RepID=UPI002894B6AF|nr:phage virion morphogenesis protein [Aromatoleum sp.]MDT3668999.1 phage virion morphogenesis protein [Aromatoleum sp.]